MSSNRLIILEYICSILCGNNERCVVKRRHKAIWSNWSSDNAPSGWFPARSSFSWVLLVPCWKRSSRSSSSSDILSVLAFLAMSSPPFTDACDTGHDDDDEEADDEDTARTLSPVSLLPGNSAIPMAARTLSALTTSPGTTYTDTSSPHSQFSSPQCNKTFTIIRIYLRLLNGTILVQFIHSFIHSGDLYSASSRDYYCTHRL